MVVLPVSWLVVSSRPFPRHVVASHLDGSVVVLLEEEEVTRDVAAPHAVHHAQAVQQQEEGGARSGTRGRHTASQTIGI